MEQYGFELNLSAPIIKTLDMALTPHTLITTTEAATTKLTDVPEHKFLFTRNTRLLRSLSLLADVAAEFQTGGN